mmetsp:Transcript_1340/g.4240  ORF Transcript_1340/g.4240 Transcript_1340/m.4240 type:complete len:249 (+) Transcript_1340:2-748(+)
MPPAAHSVTQHGLYVWSGQKSHKCIPRSLTLGCQMGLIRMLTEVFCRPDLPPPAQVVLLLGGSLRRELLCAAAAGRRCPQAALLLSSGCADAAELAAARASCAGAADVPVLVDCRAVDTVTNFTSVVEDLAGGGVASVSIATDRAHARRAAWVGSLILCSQGIAVAEPISVDSGEVLCESALRTLRDCLRALLWVACGWHLGWLNSLRHPSRVGVARGTEGRMFAPRCRVAERAFAHWIADVPNARER